MGYKKAESEGDGREKGLVWQSQGGQMGTV